MWIPLAEWWYNTNFHSAIQTTPFEVVCGQAPPIHLPYLPGEARHPAVERTLSAGEAVIQLLKFHLLRVQNRMAQHADRHRSDRLFSIGNFVYLKLQPYNQFSIRKQSFHKLLPKFYGPYRILDRIGTVAYQLELPPNSEIHNVFHVSQMKSCNDSLSAATHPLPSQAHLQFTKRDPEAILDRKMVKRGRIAATKVLVKWKNLPSDQATWEFYYDLLKKFPNFHP